MDEVTINKMFWTVLIPFLMILLYGVMTIIVLLVLGIYSKEKMKLYGEYAKHIVTGISIGVTLFLMSKLEQIPCEEIFICMWGYIVPIFLSFVFLTFGFLGYCLINEKIR